MTVQNEMRKSAGLKTRGGNIISLDKHVLTTAEKIKEKLNQCPKIDGVAYAQRGLKYLDLLVKTSCKAGETIKEKKKNVVALKHRLVLENWKLPYKEMLKKSNIFGEDMGV